MCATHGTYVCTEGPRLETAAEIAAYGWGGAAVVGMTLSPEVWLAAELGIPYASLCIITNMATGRWRLIYGGISVPVWVSKGYRSH